MTLDTPPPAPGTIWHHGKYGAAAVICIARHYATGEELVTVRQIGPPTQGSVAPGEFVAYPLPAFHERFTPA